MIYLNSLNIQSTLLLDSVFKPIKIISAKKAIELLYRNVVEVIEVNSKEFNDEIYYETYGFKTWTEMSYLKHEIETGNLEIEFIKTSSSVIQVPKVLRLINNYIGKKHKVRLSRKNLFERDDYTCQYCGRRLAASQLSIDHVIPKSKGGKTHWTNVVAACHKCNTKKANKTLNEANLKLRKKPKTPKSSLAFKNNAKRVKDWDHFISNVYWNTDIEEA